MEEIPNVELWAEFKKIKEENYKLRKSNDKKNREIRGMEKYIHSLINDIKKIKRDYGIKDKHNKKKNHDDAIINE